MKAILVKVREEQGRGKTASPLICHDILVISSNVSQIIISTFPELSSTPGASCAKDLNNLSHRHTPNRQHSRKSTRTYTHNKYFTPYSTGEQPSQVLTGQCLSWYHFDSSGSMTNSYNSNLLASSQRDNIFPCFA